MANKLSTEGQKAWYKYQTENIFETSPDYSQWVRTAMNCYSPAMFGLQDKDADLFDSAMLVTDGTYTLLQMNLINQIIVQVSGKSMGQTPEEYIAFRAAIKDVALRYAGVMDAAFDEHEKQYPAPPEMTVAQPAFADVMDAVRKGNKSKKAKQVPLGQA